MKILRKSLLVLACLSIVVLLAFSGYYFYVTHNVHLSQDKLLQRGANITVYDAFENTLACTDASGKQKTQLQALPVHTQYAFVDTEDKRFFSHNGYDYARIIKAFFKNLTTRSFGQGASTISQQLIKNTHLTQEKTLKRKLQEWKLTRMLEKRYSKREILENYVSIIYFGHNCFGIQSAARFYFDKQPQELTLGESCILAGLVKSPNNYSPFKNPERCQKRKAVVLNCMLRAGHITETQKNEALQEPLPAKPHTTAKSYGYTHQVFEELSEIAEEKEFNLHGSIAVRTYFDPNAQQSVQNAFSTNTNTDKTIAVIDVETRGYKAFVSTVNDLRRSPASLIKPLLVYAPAIEENLLSPATPILDEPVNFSGYCPQNYDDKYHGYVSARESVAKSYNIPAVKTLNSIGVKKAAEYLQQVGLEIDKRDYSLALALGGMQHGFTAKQLFSAYTVFANGGEYQPSAFIKSISIDGKTVYERPQKTTRVYSAETAYLTADMLSTAATTGTAKRLRGLPFPVYAKTGTAGTKQGNTDAYTVAFTQKDIVGVWIGNADCSVISHTGGGEPCNWIANIQTQLSGEYAAKGISLQAIPRPSGIVEKQLDKTAYEQSRELRLADPLSPAQYRFCELFAVSNAPTVVSETFSRPSILPPSVKVTDEGVVIAFTPQELYRYKITRYHKNKKTVVYDGAYTPTFIDETIQANERYTYGITPYYQEQIGKELLLPEITAPSQPITKKEEKKILKKNWWEE